MKIVKLGQALSVTRGTLASTTTFDNKTNQDPRCSGTKPFLQLGTVANGVKCIAS